MDQTLFYWEHIEETRKKIDLKRGDYIINIYMVNMYTCDEYYKWIPCDSKSKLLGYIKYVALPSLAICRNLLSSKDEYEDLVIYGVFSYEEAMEILGNMNSTKDYSDDYVKWYEIFDSMDEDIAFEDIKKALKDLSNIVYEENFKKGFLFNISIYKDIVDVGNSNIAAFEEEGLIDLLEEDLNIPVAEIRKMFNSVDSNKFFQKKIIDILNNMENR